MPRPTREHCQVQRTVAIVVQRCGFGGAATGWGRWCSGPHTLGCDVRARVEVVVQPRTAPEDHHLVGAISVVVSRHRQLACYIADPDAFVVRTVVIVKVPGTPGKDGRVSPAVAVVVHGRRDADAAWQPCPYAAHIGSA